MSHKNQNREWTTVRNGIVTDDLAQLATLMDIRDELQTLNRLLGCKNFIDVPKKLEAIRKNTTKRRKYE